MKKPLITLFCVALMGFGYAQETTNKSTEKPDFTVPLDARSNTMSFKIPEIYVKAFYSNPLKFAKENFDIRKFIGENGFKYESYYVYFTTQNGKLVVNYDDEGNTTYTYQKFENVALPRETNLSIYENHKGWDMVENKYVAMSSNGKVRKEFYKVKLKKGKETKTLKFDVLKDNSALGLALN